MTTDSEPDKPLSEDEISQLTAQLENSTLSSDIDVGIHGNYPSDDEATRVAQTTMVFLKMFGTSLNLAGLEAVVIADDYARALAQLDRGFKTNESLSPTNDEFGNGLAMAVSVIRNGTFRTHIVVHSGLSRSLADPKSEMYGLAVHLLAHEAAHAHDNLLKARALPVLPPPPDYKKARLCVMAGHCWSEYIACRLSARWGTNTFCKETEGMVCPMLSSARARSNAAIDQFVGPGGIVKTADEIIGIYGALLGRISYLLGHVHGLGANIEEMAPDFLSLVVRTPWFKPLFEQYELDLKALHESYPDSWQGTDVFEPLMLTCETLLNAGGMFFVRQMDGDYYIGLNRQSE